jgi:hypothetical protein
MGSRRIHCPEKNSKKRIDCRNDFRQSRAPAMENIDKEPNEISGEPASPIVLFDRFLESLGVTPATGWRWRNKGWIKTLNISGRLYISRAEINRFQQRVAAGEFSKIHKTPRHMKAIIT